MQYKKDALKRVSAALAVFLLAVAYSAGLPSLVSAATLTSVSESITDSRPSTTSVSYTTTASGVTLSAIKCIKIQFNTAADGTGSVPTGMTTTGSVTLNAASNYMPTPASWSIANATNGSVYVYDSGGTETPASASTRTVQLDGITNGSTADTGYYAIISSYAATTGSGASTTCSGASTDTGTAMFIYTNGQAVSLTVNPLLTFTVAGVASGGTVNGSTDNVTTTATTIPFGTGSTSTNTIGSQTLTISENGTGYTVYERYTGALSNGSHSITDWSGTNLAPTTFSAAGTESFGYTTDDATLSAVGNGANRFSSGKWAGFTTTNAEVAHNTTAVSSEATHVGYQVGISTLTPTGSYATNVVVTATPTY